MGDGRIEIFRAARADGRPHNTPRSLYTSFMDEMATERESLDGKQFNIAFCPVKVIINTIIIILLLYNIRGDSTGRQRRRTFCERTIYNIILKRNTRPAAVGRPETTQTRA